MYYLHRQSNGWYTVDKNSHLNGVEGEPFESFHSAIYFGRLWQIQQEEQNKGEGVMEEVNCCDNGGWIYYNSEEGVFKLIGYDGNVEGLDYGNHPIEYCPWCGILLDTNLLED